MYRKFFKRFFDIAISLTASLFLLPIFIAISVIIKIDSKGPVFFIQKRAGRKMRYFDMYKFRTMTVCGESERKEFEPGEKKRVTRFGSFLRKTKLDEIPQLMNVIKGDMSIAGPRPEVKKYVDVYPERWEKILSERPGITDSASINFRGEEGLLASSPDPEHEYKEKIMPLKLDLYEKYISNITFVNDVKIIFSTIFAVCFK
jgi:lipopolysaccharide/colanic/teichoic acid biosynthesis glycosyltransferase